MKHLGVTLDSRYDRQDELITMRKIIDCLPILARASLLLVFCDSKAGGEWLFEVRQDTGEMVAREIAAAARGVLWVERGGWNGIRVVPRGQWSKMLVEVEPEWFEDPTAEKSRA